MSLEDFDDWINQGMQLGYCGPIVCLTHDGVPSTADEDNDEYADDLCLPVIRPYQDDEQKRAIEANHPPSRWRKTNKGD